MRRHAKLLVVSALLLAVAHVAHAWVQFADTAYLAVLSGFAATLGIVGVVWLCRGNYVESRLVTAAVAMSTLVGHLLVTAVGLPGRPEATSPSLLEIVIVALACSTLLLLVLSSSRSRSQPPIDSPGNSAVGAEVDRDRRQA